MFLNVRTHPCKKTPLYQETREKSCARGPLCKESTHTNNTFSHKVLLDIFNNFEFDSKDKALVRGFAFTNPSFDGGPLAQNLGKTEAPGQKRKKFGCPFHDIPCAMLRA
eukprot:4053527-Amphidinium_carterae.1